MNKEKRTAAYLRVSSDTQNVDGQVLAIEAEARTFGILDIDWYIDDGVSGSTMDRQKLKALTGQIHQYRVGTVIMYDLDRFSRDALGGMILMRDWLNHDVRLIVVTLKIDFRGEVGQMVASLLLHIAEMQRSEMLKRQELGLRAAKQKQARARELAEQGKDIYQIAVALGVRPERVEKMLKSRKDHWWGSRDDPRPTPDPGSGGHVAEGEQTDRSTSPERAWRPALCCLPGQKGGARRQTGAGDEKPVQPVRGDLWRYAPENRHKSANSSGIEAEPIIL
jgi:DNA invertase Pin-like site-specific DNA recombinase